MSIEQRLQRLEGALAARGRGLIEPRDKIIGISYPNGNRAEFERLKQERLAKHGEKYGRTISEDDFLVIGIRKFYRHRVAGES